LKDRVKETTTTTGTGTITLAGAVTGYQSFSTIGNANTTYYCIAGQGTSEWEVGVGTYTLSGTTLARTTILASSNSGSAVNFSAGTKDVFCTFPAGKVVASQGELPAFDDVGTYAFAGGNANFTAGTTYSGSSLNPAAIKQTKANTTIYLAIATLSGTWRAMGTSAGSGESATLFLRIV
jgi:hypothetical protein